MLTIAAPYKSIASTSGVSLIDIVDCFSRHDTKSDFVPDRRVPNRERDGV